MVERVTSRHDTELRFHNTLVQYRGDYYYATITGEDSHRVHLRDPINTETILHLSVDPNSDDFEANNFLLGYLNWDEGLCYYLERMPMRQQKQGLARSTLAAFRAGNCTNEGCGTRLFFSRGMLDMLRGIYPSVPEALASVLLSRDQSISGVGISREFCIKRGTINEEKEKTLNLYYKQQPVGIIDEKLHIVNLRDVYNHSIFRQRLSKLGFVVG